MTALQPIFPSSDFTEIPLKSDLAQPQERHDGWSPDRQVVFLEALARTGNVKASALYAGLSRESAYKLRRRPDARAFARAWDAALIHARDVFQDELLERGLNGWDEAVWHQGEEVGMRERWSAPLFLAALGRLDRMADGLDMAGNPARAAAENFDELMRGIAQGDDCGDLVEKIDATAESFEDDDQDDLSGRSDAELMAVLERQVEMKQIYAMAPEDIDVSDLDVTQSESWSDLDWERADRSGLLKSSGMLDSPAQDEIERSEKE
ncbi:hypothetical protein AB1K62_13060 [Parasphingorhabdus sp. JC815]|uniref:hypothetical protein n=1 Tax=Parasphingorhabdus sp. JC815 TaxID=3232140 RepID=UPI003458F05B